MNNFMFTVLYLGLVPLESHYMHLNKFRLNFPNLIQNINQAKSKKNG